MSKVNEIVTGLIIEKLEAGVVPWHKPWQGSAPKSFATKKAYRGINTLLLGFNAYECPFYATFRQIKEKGGSIKKGEKGHLVVFYKWIDRDTVQVDDTGAPVINSIPFLRYYKVFNLEQCEGIDYSKYIPVPKEIDTIQECESIVDSFSDMPEIIHGGARAYYMSSQDKIGMPEKNTFDDAESFYDSLFHEMVHSTGHSSRLSRKGIVVNNSFGSTDYSKEELIAEIGAAFLCNGTGIVDRTIDNSASYIQSWIRALKQDKTKKLVITAASQAQKAVDYITA